jgi:enoyl-CoA hydratase
MSNALLVEQVGRKIIIRFNRPELRNPLSVNVLNELTRLMGAIKNRDDIDAVIFTGVGDVFASGADLREIGSLDAEDASGFALRGQDLMKQISELPIETLAAINGVCFGGALDLALACKRRIAAPDSLFSHPGANLGIITGWGGTQRLPRLVGEAIALEMFFTAKRLTAQEALSCGLIDAIADNVLELALGAVQTSGL